MTELDFFHTVNASKHFIQNLKYFKKILVQQNEDRCLKSNVLTCVYYASIDWRIMTFSFQKYLYYLFLQKTSPTLKKLFSSFRTL